MMSQALRARLRRVLGHAVLLVLALLLGLATTIAIPVLYIVRTGNSIPAMAVNSSRADAGVVDPTARKAGASPDVQFFADWCSESWDLGSGVEGAQATSIFSGKIMRVPRWVQVPSASAGITHALTNAHGWPLRCLKFTIAHHTDSSQQWVGTARMGGDWFPLIPIVANLWLNTALGGLLWWVVLTVGFYFASGRFTRRRRLARNHCPLCAYDLKSQPTPGCPECGWLRAAEFPTPPPSPPTAHDPATGPRS